MNSFQIQLIVICSFILLINFPKCAGYASGGFTVLNKGGYAARFSVTFQYANGIEMTYHSGDYSAGYSKTLEMPMDVKSCQILVENAVWFGTYRTIFAQSFDKPVTKCYAIWGSTFVPFWVEESFQEPCQKQFNKKLLY